MEKKYIYGGLESEVSDASGVSGLLIKKFDGGYCFRVDTGNHNFIDYELNHDDLPVTIDRNSLASFYVNKKCQVLDHSPQVLDLKS